MRSFWSEPFFWIHLAGLAVLPITLGLCLIGLAVGDPVLPIAVELLLVAAIGILPILWMQWFRPFYIFSVGAIALKPERLTLVQRRMLSLFKCRKHQVLALGTSIVLAGILWQLYQMAPVAAKVVAFLGQWRLLGLAIAAIAFLASNLFLQVPVSVVQVMLRSKASLDTTEPYPLEQVCCSFTIPGFQVNQILPAAEAALPSMQANAPNPDNDS